MRRLFAAFHHDPARGIVRLSGERYVLVRAASLSVELFDVVASLYGDRGEVEAHDVTNGLLFDLSHALGKADAKSFHERMGVDDPIDRLAAGPVHFAFAGWAKVHVLPESSPQPNDAFLLVYEHIDSFEADAWLQRRRTTTTPVCIMNAGYSSGWCEESFGIPLVAVEITCRARGDENCRFVMARPDRIPGHIARFAKSARRNDGEGAAPHDLEVPEFFGRKRTEEQLRTANAALETRAAERASELSTLTQRLEESVALNRAFLHSSPMGFGVLDPNLEFVFINDALASILGGSAASFVGRRVADVVPLLWRSIEPLLRHAMIDDVPTTHHDISGETAREPGVVRHWTTTCFPIRLHDGQLVGVGVTATENTENRRAESERRRLLAQALHAQKLESIGYLAGGVAHDFNNLLLGILGSANLALLDLPADSPIREHLETIEQAGMRAADLTRQLLAYAGRGRFVQERIDLSSLCREMVALLEAAIPHRVKLAFELSESSTLVLGDGAQLRQIVISLVTNAAEACRERGGTIRIATGSTNATRAKLDRLLLGADLEPGRFAYLEIEDDGVGMDDAVLARAFEPFYSTKPSARGLGLAAVEGIVRGHSGAIDLHSKIGRGTTIRVYLPSLDEAMRQAPEHDTVEVSADRWQGSGRILVADDEEEVRRVAGALLTRFGFDVIMARTGDEAIDLLHQPGPAIAAILLDFSMPGLATDDTVAAIRSMYPSLPVLLSSGYDDDRVLGVVERFPHTMYLPKPYRPATLRNALRQMLR
ncbi:MAG: PAS domain-containing protein [Planctomycetes bacterium]|nr:PAS domain-containing protein [Planctomycetota bacterium]MCC7172417.1 PAS domain-containing protein [Planctomycetota bacterium]